MSRRYTKWDVLRWSNLYASGSPDFMKTMITGRVLDNGYDPKIKA